jgi:hypothetical protein
MTLRGKCSESFTSYPKHQNIIYEDRPRNASFRSYLEILRRHYALWQNISRGDSSLQIFIYNQNIYFRLVLKSNETGTRITYGRHMQVSRKACRVQVLSFHRKCLKCPTLALILVSTSLRPDSSTRPKIAGRIRIVSQTATVPSQRFLFSI